MAEEEKKEPEVKEEAKESDYAKATPDKEAKEEKPAEAPKEEAKAEKSAEAPKAEEKKEPDSAKASDSTEVTPDKTPDKEEKKEEKPAPAEAPKVEAPKASDSAKASDSTEVTPDKTPDKEEPAVELSKEAQKIVDTLKNMSVLELSKLVKELESVFGVSAAAPVAVAGAPAAGAPGAEGGEEKTAFDVVLAAAGDKKIQVIKEVRTITGLGLKEAKDLVDGAPKPVKQGVNKEEADKIKGQLEGAGATVEVK